MTEVGKERAALQRGAAIHLNDALAKTKGYVLSGEKLKAARTETQGWLDGVDDAMLAFSQFQLSLNEVRNSSHVGDQWSTAEWEVVAARLDVVSRSDYGKETPDERMRRERRRELLELDDAALRAQVDAKIANISKRLWEKGREAVAEFMLS